MPKHSFTHTLKIDGFPIATRTVERTEGGGISKDVVVANLATNQLVTVSVAAAAIKGIYVDSTADAKLELNSPGGNEVQTITITGGVSGGTFTLTFDALTTAAIQWNAAATTVDSALEALSNIGAGNVAVTGNGGGPWTVTFTGTLAETNVSQLVPTNILLIGGTPNIQVATTNQGGAGGPTTNLKAGIPLVWHPDCYYASPFAVDITAMYLSNTSGLQADVTIRLLTT